MMSAKCQRALTPALTWSLGHARGRWTALRSSVSPTRQARTASPQVRLLLITVSAPPPTGRGYGIHQRIDLLLRSLDGLSEIDVLYFCPQPIDRHAVEPQLEARWGVPVRVMAVPPEVRPRSRWALHLQPLLSAIAGDALRGTSGPGQSQAVEQALACRPEVVLAQGLAGIAPLVRGPRRPRRILFDLNDVEHVRWSRVVATRSRRLQRALGYAQLPLLIRFERRAAALARCTLVCSEHDRSYLSRVWRIPRLLVAPNAVAIHPPLPPSPRPIVLFASQLGYWPNLKALGVLLEEVWPRLRDAVPEARLAIAGRSPDDVPALRNPPPGVEPRGYVEDLSALYREARVICAPITVAGGTRVKILEAAAHSRAVVTTRIGAEGLSLRDGEEIVLGSDPATIAAECARLLRDPDRCRRIGEAAWHHVAEHYRRETVAGRLRPVLRAALGDGG